MKSTIKKAASTVLLLAVIVGLIMCSSICESYAAAKVKTPARVKIIKAESHNDKVILRWKKQKCSGYEIFHKTNSGKWKKIGKVKSGSRKSSCRFTDKNLKDGKHQYRVRAYRKYKKNGKIRKKYGKYSKTVTVKVRTKPGKKSDEDSPGMPDSPADEEKAALAGTTIHFLTPVNVTKDEVENDPSVLMLPDGYSENGKPTRLVIWCHGAGGTVSPDDSQTENFIIPKYLAANGYAVLDTNGLPFGFADRNGINRRDNVGSPIAVQSYTNAYNYVIENYNICQDGVFVGGESMGGISSTNLVMSENIPVIAHGALCPVLDTYNEIWLHPWNYGTPKVALTVIYGFRKLLWKYVYIESKVKGFNPVNNNTTTIDGKKCTYYPCPVKFWHCDDDPVVNAEITKEFVQQINNAGGAAIMSSLPYGGHSPESVGEVLAEPSGNTNFRGETLEIKPVTEEVLLWFNSFEEIQYQTP